MLDLEHGVAVPHLTGLVIGRGPDDDPLALHVAASVATCAETVDLRPEPVDGDGSSDVLEPVGSKSHQVVFQAADLLSQEDSAVHHRQSLQVGAPSRHQRGPDRHVIPVADPAPARSA